MFQQILLELLQTIDGSLGALFLDWEGECVEVITERPFHADDLINEIYAVLTRSDEERDAWREEQLAQD